MISNLVLTAIIYSLGIFAGEVLKLNLGLLLFVLLIVYICLSINIKKGIYFELFFVLLVFLSGVFALQNAKFIPMYDISRQQIILFGDECILKGDVSNYPVITPVRTKFYFKVNELCKEQLCYSVKGNVFIDIKGRKDVVYLDRLLIKGKFDNFIGGRIKNIYCRLKVDSPYSVKRLKTKVNPSFKKKIFDFKTYIQDRISRYLSSFSSNILFALILGEKYRLGENLTGMMKRTGTLHILAWQYTKLSNCSFPNNITL